jgi:AAA domain
VSAATEAQLEFDGILSELRARGKLVRAVGETVHSQCPNHPDKIALTVQITDDHAAVRCFKGCTQDQVLTGLGIGIPKSRPRTCSICGRRAGQVKKLVTFDIADEFPLCDECIGSAYAYVKGPERVFDEDVEREAQKIRIREGARTLLAEEEAAKNPLPNLVGLGEFLEEEDDTPPQIIRGLWNQGTPVLMAAQYKAGKTTMRDNVIKSLADGFDFLDRFQVNQLTEGTIVVIDLELSPNMMRKWLKSHGIKNTDRVKVLPMRGKGGQLNFTLPSVRQQWVSKLVEVNCKVLILDCLRPILDSLGLSEDKEAGRFLNGGVDPLVADANIDYSMVIHHMGHSGDRARGDSSMLGWGDSWTIVRENEDPSSQRFFKAYGRDIEVPQGTLELDGLSRHLSYTKGTKADAEAMAAWECIKPWIASHEPDPVRGVVKVVEAFGKGQDLHEPIPERRVRKALQWAESASAVRISETRKGVAAEIWLTHLEFLEEE